MNEDVVVGWTSSLMPSRNENAAPAMKAAQGGDQRPEVGLSPEPEGMVVIALAGATPPRTWPVNW